MARHEPLAIRNRFVRYAVKRLGLTRVLRHRNPLKFLEALAYDFAHLDELRETDIRAEGCLLAMARANLPENLGLVPQWMMRTLLTRATAGAPRVRKLWYRFRPVSIWPSASRSLDVVLSLSGSRLIQPPRPREVRKKCTDLIRSPLRQICEVAIRSKRRNDR